MKLPEISVRRPVTTVMVFAAIILLGSVAFFKLNLDLLPDIEPPAVSVITPYPGASATDVESEVTKYLEDQLSTTPDLDRLESKSKDNIAIVTCVFNWGTDLDVAVNDIREKIDLAKPDLADGAKEPFIFKFSSSMVPVLIMTVTAQESNPDLYRIVDKQIADPLKRVSGVGAVVYIGGQERQINVHFDRAAIEAYHLSVQQIRNVFAAENLNLPVGTAEIGRNELQIRVAGRYRDAAEIANTVIGSDGDALVRLRDVATVTDAFEEPQEWARSGKLPAIALLIQKQSGANTVTVIKTIKERLKTLKTEVPADIEIHKVLDNSDHIYSMIYNLTEAAVVGGLLVIVVCFLFLRRFRTSLVVTMAIPFSIIVAFIGLFAMGYTINVISLMSLAIAVGMVVDDAIVVLENIVRHVDDGKSPRLAAVEGASEVGMAVAASTLTIVAVFAPLLLVKGLAGIIFGQLAFIILITILASLFISLTLTPMASSRLLRSRDERKLNPVFAWSERLLNKIEAGYSHALEWGLRHRKMLLSLIIIVFTGSLALIPLVGTEFFPEVDSGEVEVVLEMQQGTRVEVTAGITQEMLKAVNAIPEMQASYALAGQTKKGFLTALGFEEGTNIGRIGGRLVEKEERSRHAKEIASELREQAMKLPGVEKFSASAVSAIQKAFLGGGRAISIDILGHDIEMTNKVAAEIRRIVEATPGSVDVSVSRKKPRPEVQVRLDRDKAASLGLNVALVADALRTNYYGFDDTKFREAGDDFDIELRLKKDQRETIRGIGETPITTLTGQTIKLRNVASVREAFGPVEIERKNRTRVTKVQAGVQGRVLGDVVRDVREKMASLDLPPGVSIEWGGEVEEQRKAFRDLTLLLILGIALVYMVMAGEFEDFVDPFIIMFSVPFAFVGVIWAFVVTATPLNLMSFIGVIMLMGIVVKNAIVLVDYTKQLRAGGMTLNEAIVTGGKTRLRPVLMTSLTTIFGMLPLALSRGEGSEIWNALGITVIGGLLVSGLVTLILVPLVYSLVHRSWAQ
ncbi:efflux RND transporter permease subunit [Desulfobulbus rhabdoformis]|jgi:HAE1 family hydrophobic/amphiphilic exporter-1|uniref:efflux RND transporter permease subunit n=1 Tax=Desulfobulbus rhabdoformis TaxID=34032 RepID=UPI0006708A51|nr:efflux RND transporter permease subunit [Desulfobulbus rhabdoformis]KMY67427.1 acriflavin resistance protein [Desulfocarbo indianensis]MBM9612916.1 efflux RND transporter permease subunit [Desulfobulbus rhabdoformis]